MNPFEEMMEMVDQQWLRHEEAQGEHRQLVLKGILGNVGKILDNEEEAKELTAYAETFLKHCQTPVLDEGCSVYFGVPANCLESKVLGPYEMIIAENKNPNGRHYVLGISDLRKSRGRKLANFLKNRLGSEISEERLKEVVSVANENGAIDLVFVNPKELNAQLRNMSATYTLVEKWAYAGLSKDGKLYVTSVGWWNGVPKDVRRETTFYFNSSPTV